VKTTPIRPGIAILGAAFLFLLSSPAYGERDVPYSVGEYGTEAYEVLEFQVKDNGRTEIYYSYGKTIKSVRLRYLGTDLHGHEACFKVQFPNKYILYVIPTGLSLKVVDDKGKYLKVFSWQYEGPVDGRGTFCEVCAQSPEEAMRIVKNNFMK